MSFTLLATDWTADSSPVVGTGESANFSTPQPAVSNFTDNGTITVAAGGSIATKGTSLTTVGSGDGGFGTLTIQAGGSVTNQGTGHFVVGYLGGTGHVSIASGGVFWQSNDNTHFYLAKNEDGDVNRSHLSRGEVEVSGLLHANYIEMLAFFPITGLTAPYAESARLTIHSGGVVEVGQFQKNDLAASTILFDGGTLRMIKNNDTFFIGGGVTDMVLADNTQAIFDTAGHDVKIQPWAAPFDTALSIHGSTIGNGGFRKLGAGKLSFGLAAAQNTFTGNIEVVEGTLSLGRPLADNQRVTVYTNANFVVCANSDLDKITYVNGGTTDRMLFTVGGNLDTIDLTSVNASYYDDRLGGPILGSPTLSGTLTHTAGTAGAPFRLIGQGSTLNLTNTTLESSVIQVEGSGTFSFLGDRTMTSADTSNVIITDGGFRQNGTLFLADPSASTPATLSFNSGRFSAGSLSVGVNGYGTFLATNANATVAPDQMNVGGGTGYTGCYTQSVGTVTISSYDSYIGLNGGSAFFAVTGGQFIVNSGYIRLASNPSGNTALRPSADVLVRNALFRCNALFFTSWWPNTGTPLSLEPVTLTLDPGAQLEASYLYKNDDAIANLVFNGGVLRARKSTSDNGGLGLLNSDQVGTLRVRATAGNNMLIDTAGTNIALNAKNGTLALTGDGGFCKIGAGVLTFSATSANYLGDTQVSNGVLRLGSNNLIPDGSGYGNVRLNSGAVLDLYGMSETINKLKGFGRVISTNALATLGVLSDGSDDTWAYNGLSGQIVLDKKGAGTLTLSPPATVPTNLVVSAGTVKLGNSSGYPFYRFKIESVKDPANAVAMQFSELALYCDGVNVVPNRTNLYYDTTGGVGGDSNVNAWPGGEMPEKAVDGIVNPEVPAGQTGSGNKWLDFRIKSSRSAEDHERVWIRIDFPGVQKITSYNWATGNDSPDRDPAAWRLQGSYDGATWTDIDVQNGFYSTDNRNAWVSSGGFSVSTANNGLTATDILSDNAQVVVKEGAALELGSTAETIGGLTGPGTVNLNSASLTVSLPSGTTNTFNGMLTGAGSLIKTGLGTQILCGTNVLTGGVIVQDGNLVVRNAQPYHWFRITFMKNRSSVDVLQISELALYDRNGQRQNQNLTAGSDVSSLGAGQFATPWAYPLGSSGEGTVNLFDNSTGTKWCTNQNTPTVGDPSTYRTIVMRLSDSAPEIVSYNMCTANDAPERDPITWVLEGSPDGTTWATLDYRSDIGAPTARFIYYNGSVPYTLATLAVGGIGGSWNVIPSGSALEVRSGATVTFDTTDTLGALTVDMTSAGTINTFNAEPNGTLYIVNATGNGNGLVLPLTIGSVVNASNLQTWKVYVNGVLQNGLMLSASDGTLHITAKGTLIMLK